MTEDQLKLPAQQTSRTEVEIIPSREGKISPWFHLRSRRKTMISISDSYSKLLTPTQPRRASSIYNALWQSRPWHHVSPQAKSEVQSSRSTRNLQHLKTPPAPAKTAFPDTLYEVIKKRIGLKPSAHPIMQCNAKKSSNTCERSVVAPSVGWLNRVSSKQSD